MHPSLLLQNFVATDLDSHGDNSSNELHDFNFVFGETLGSGVDVMGGWQGGESGTRVHLGETLRIPTDSGTQRWFTCPTATKAGCKFKPSSH